MEYRRLHPWDVSPQEAIRIQQKLRTQVAARDADRTEFRLVAGMDVSYDKHSPWLFAAIVVLRLPGFQREEAVGVRAEAKFPYVPGLLSFRESPAGLEAWERLRTRPDCLICDGHGYAHPRRFGFACHFGLLVDLPTIGFAKRVLIGSFKAPGAPRGSTSDLVDGGEVIGQPSGPGKRQTLCSCRSGTGSAWPRPSQPSSRARRATGFRNRSVKRMRW